jgi:hypothetical protein
MPLHQPNTLATFLFTGLGLLEFNQKKQCEVKILQCPDHILTLDIFEITLNPVTGEDDRSASIFHPLSLQEDIDIYLELKHPSKHDARPHLVSYPAFDRATDHGDEHDFRWVLDIENEVHKVPLREKKVLLRNKNGDGAFLFKPKLAFSNGLFYTEKKEKMKVALTSLDARPRDRTHRMLGKIAFMIGADITCPPEKGNNVVLKDRSKKVQKLPWKPNIRYEIKINNTCTLPDDDQTGTDFTIYSKVLEPVSGKTNLFDLRQVIEHNGNPSGRRLEDNMNFVVDSHQQACDLVTK